MAALTDASAERVLNWLTGQSAIAPIPPLMVALLTVGGDDINPGVEVTGGGYSRQIYSPTIASTAGGVTSVRNQNLIRYENMPACVVTSFAVWDSGPTPFRWFYADLTTPRAFDAGDPAEWGTADLVLTST